MASNNLTTSANGINISVGKTFTGSTKTANTLNHTSARPRTAFLGSYSKIVVVLPGETFVSGTGKTGTPTVPTAGTAFNITLYATDATNDLLVTVNEAVTLTSTDPNATLPTGVVLVAGTATCNVTYKTSGARTITATGTKTGASTSVTVATAAYAKLQVLLFGETAAPGTSTGKTGSPTPVTAGGTCLITVNAVDIYWNKVSLTDVVNLTSTDAGASFTASSITLATGTKQSTITLRAPGSTTITAADSDPTKTGTSAAITVSLGPLTSLITVLPGETFTPGMSAAKSGSPTAPVAGTSFNFSVYAVDAGNNLLTAITDNVAITSSDVNAALPATAALSAGAGTFNFTFKTAGAATITATDVPTGTTATTASLTVAAGAYAKLQVLLTGETAKPGTASGKIGTPTAITAGGTTTATITAVDANWNRVTIPSDVVTLSASDAGATFTPTTVTLTTTAKTSVFTLRAPGGTTITAADSDPTKTGTSAAITVSLGPLTSLITVLPGETFTPGMSAAKSGSPTAPVAGTSFNFSVYAVDAGNNLLTAITDNVTITSSDVNAALPATAALSAGAGTFNFTFKTAGAATITATDVPTGTTATTASLTVAAGAYAKLQVLLTGETAKPGTASGKIGTPTAITAGGTTTATITAVDANWNRVTIPSDVVTLSASDAGATFTPTTVTLTTTAKTSVFTLRTAGTTTITAADSDPTKTGTSAAITVNLGAYAALLTVLPGETFKPGTITGKSGSPTAPVAGNSFSFNVYAVDAANNVVTTVADNVAITSTDVNAALPATAALSAGVGTFNFTFKTAGAATITATDVPTSTTVTTASLVVATGAYAKLQVLLTGETAAPGTATGKSGSPTGITAGGTTTATITAVDANWNRVTIASDVVTLSASDAGATFTPTTVTLTTTAKTSVFTLRTAGSTTITAADSDPTKTGTSAAITVSQGAYVALLTVLPGETFKPGTITGKSGTPTTPVVAGASFTFNVYAVDAANNVVTSITNNVAITSTDANAALPATTALSAGAGTYNFTFKTAGSGATITATDATASTTITTGALTVIPGVFTKLLVILPGETVAPGTATGKSGSPTAERSGAAFNIIVNAVDANWNRVSSVTSVNPTAITDPVSVVSNDPAVATPFTGTMAAGTKTISITLKTTTAAATLQANDAASGTTILSNTSANFTVTSGVFAKLQILLPGQTAAPNTTNGYTLTGSTAGTAGVPYTVTVNAVDKDYNIINTVTDQVSLTITNDANAIVPAAANLVGGTHMFTVTFKTAGTGRKITPINNTTPTIKVGANSSFTVIPNTFVKLLAIFPGETYAPGTATGKSGTPNGELAGTSFNVKVYAVDANWNRIIAVSATNPTLISDALSISTNDPAYLPSGIVSATKVLAKGVANIGITLKTPTTPGALASLTFADSTHPTITAYTQSSLTVTNGTFAKLLLLMPGESSAPGTTTGKTGTALQQTAGVPFTVTVYAVDAAWNIMTTPTDKVSITSTTDPNAPAITSLNLVGGTQTFSYMFVTAGNRSAIASDVTDGTKTKSTGTVVAVVPGAYAKLLVLLPNETAKPGLLPDGKIGAANPPRNTNFTITIDAVDAYFNLVTTLPSTSITVSLDDHSPGAYITTATPGIYSGTVTLTSGTKTGIPVDVISTSSSPLPNIIATDPATSITKTEPIPLSVPPTLATDYFRPLTSGSWNDSSIWQASTDGMTNWHATTLVPGAASFGITILSGDSVNVPATPTISVSAGTNGGKLTIANGGQVAVAAGGTLNIGANGADVHGIISNAGTITPTGTLMFFSDGDYRHNFTTTVGTIPTATWDSQSTCEIIGYTGATGTIGGGGQQFGNFVWNTPGQGTTGVALGGVTIGMNSLTITSTGSGSFQLLTTNATTNLTVKNFTQTDGNVILNNSTSGTANLNITGDFNVSGGTMSTTGNNLISFTGTSKQNFIKPGGTFSNALNFAINTGAIVDFDTNVLDGSTGTFNLKTGGTLITANDDGISATGGTTGTIQSTGTRTFTTTANYTYDGSNPQNAGSGLPTALAGNLTVNNINDLLLPATTVTYTLSGALTLTSGDLDMNANTLAIGTGFTASGGGFIRTQSVAAAAIPSGKTWTVGVEYYGASAQTVVAGTYSNLSFSQEGGKTVVGNIAVTGNWSSGGGDVDFLTTPATAQFTGTTQTLDDSSDDGVVFGNVTFGNSGTKTMNSGNFNISPKGILTMAGTATLAAAGNLTILTDSAGTGAGYIDVIPTGASITGSVSVQTFFTGGNDLTNRGYRLVSSPVSDPTSANTNFNLSFLQGGGSYLTGASGGGFDVVGNPTLYLYREDQTPSTTSFTAGTFRAITAINNTPAYLVGTIDGAFNLPVGTGVMYFYRGNNSTVISNAPNDLIFTATGTVNQGQIVVSPWWLSPGSNLSYTTDVPTSPRFGNIGYNLVGNPYPCSIDWNSLNTSSTTTGIYAPSASLDQTIYIYNPQIKNYATYTKGAGTGVNGASNIIPSGQGFFVRALNTSAKLIFNETAKVTSHPTTVLLNAAAPTLLPMHMHLQLSKDSISRDENAFVFNNAAHANYTLNEDGLYFPGAGAVSLSNLSADNKRLAINQLPLPKQKEVIPLHIAVTSTGTYKFTVNEITNIPGVYDILLVDTYLRDSLDLKANKTYAFIVNSDTASTGNNRFKLTIKPNAALAVHLLSFDAVKNPSEVKVNWTVENEANYTQYILERSVDGGKTFTVLDSLLSANLGTYNDLDPHPVTGQNMYRLKQIDLVGNITYSNIITVMYALPGNNSIVSSRISLYPNPTTNTLNLTLKSSDNTAVTGNYKITITNSSGIIVKTATSAQPDWHSDVSTLTPGTYFIEVINTKDNSLTGRSAFVKL